MPRWHPKNRSEETEVSKIFSLIGKLGYPCSAKIFSEKMNTACRIKRSRKKLQIWDQGGGGNFCPQPFSG